jgi:hypothetical protein
VSAHSDKSKKQIKGSNCIATSLPHACMCSQLPRARGRALPNMRGRKRSSENSLAQAHILQTCKLESSLYMFYRRSTRAIVPLWSHLLIDKMRVIDTRHQNDEDV